MDFYSHQMKFLLQETGWIYLIEFSTTTTKTLSNRTWEGWYILSHFLQVTHNIQELMQL